MAQSAGTADGRTSVGRLARTYLHQLCIDTKGNLEELPGAMDDRDRWEERMRVREICTVSATL